MITKHWHELYTDKLNYKFNDSEPLLAFLPPYKVQSWTWTLVALDALLPIHLTQGKNKPAIKTSAREKVILIYSLYDQSTVDHEKDNETLPSKFLFSCTDPRGVFTNAPRGMIPTALSICSIVATRRASSLITSFKEKQANFKGRAFLVVISEKKPKVTTKKPQQSHQLGWH